MAQKQSSSGPVYGLNGSLYKFIVLLWHMPEPALYVQSYMIYSCLIGGWLYMDMMQSIWTNHEVFRMTADASTYSHFGYFDIYG